MLSYQHGFHAGNRADVLKHAVLDTLLRAAAKGPRPLFYVETHSGRGRYDLTNSQARKRGESDDGVIALMKGQAFQPSQHGVQIYFTALDVDGTLQRVQDRGGQVVLPKTQIGPLGLIASFTDSEGNRIGLRSRQ